MLPIQGGANRVVRIWRPSPGLSARCLTTGLSLASPSDPIFHPIVSSPLLSNMSDTHLNIDRSICISHGRLGDTLPSGDGSYVQRMVGPSEVEVQQMLNIIGIKSLTELCNLVIPTARTGIPPARDDLACGLPEKGLSERKAQELANETLGLNEKGWRSFLGAHHYNTHTPAVLINNVLMNPSWYSAYTPYQAEISQGRLEALYNFQKIFSELSGLPVANAGLLDVGSAAAEAVLLALRTTQIQGNRVVLVDRGVCPMILDVLRTRLKFLNVTLFEFDHMEGLPPMDNVVAAVYQTPDIAGRIVSNISRIASQCHDYEAKVIAITDPLALALFEPPGRQGADIVLGSSQRFGVPMGCGGPAASYFAVTNELIRQLPGRLVAECRDSRGTRLFRLALQTREQHIRRDAATSNICTAQSLPAVLSQFWVSYTGSDAIKDLARRVFSRTADLAEAARELGFSVEGENSWLRYGRHFGVVGIRRRDLGVIRKWAEEAKLNFAYDSEKGVCRIHVDELMCDEEVYKQVLHCLYKAARELSLFSCATVPLPHTPPVVRTTPFLEEHPWKLGKSDTEILRECVDMGSRDIGLQTNMIPLGSCTMKHNPTSGLASAFLEPTLVATHPLAPPSQNRGTVLIASMLSTFLCQLTGLDHCSLQPNAGSSGELAGLHAIREYHIANGQSARDVCLIPSSAHGTNCASAALAGFKVVQVSLQPNGHIDLKHLEELIQEHRSKIGCLMLTYPSTHGLFEAEAIDAVRLVHQSGGLVYVDGANMNAQMGLTSPGAIGADACHLNLHKTFGIPHGGGGPGVGPICVRSLLRDYLPCHRHFETHKNVIQPMGIEMGKKSREDSFISFAHAPLGSASLLVIPWMYLLLMGKAGLERSSQIALLNANYLRKRLFDSGLSVSNNPEEFCGHEFILKVDHFGKNKISEEDIAKRLMDYGFHAPTMSWPIKNSLMIEPTECENRASLEAFADALTKIAKECDDVAKGKWPLDDNPLKNAPHPLIDVTDNDWLAKPYTMQEGCFPVSKRQKYWPAVNRADAIGSDKALIKKGRT